MMCSSCGRFVCPMREVSGITGCRDGGSFGLLARTIQDTPKNEGRLRGYTYAPM